MKKNILTIIILAITFINVVLSAIMIFAIVPTSHKTNQLINRIAAIVDLELESPDAKEEPLAVTDISNYALKDKLTINLKKSDSNKHYAIVYANLSINKKHKDTETYMDYIPENENKIREIITEEFSKYSILDADSNKPKIREQILMRIQELFNSNFIIDISFGNIVYD